jgi:hypothetical protein
LERYLKEVKLEVEEIEVDKTKAEMNSTTLSNFLITKNKDETNVTHYIEQLRAQRDTL